jgi:hypothetical protein
MLKYITNKIKLSIVLQILEIIILLVEKYYNLYYLTIIHNIYNLISTILIICKFNYLVYNKTILLRYLYVHKVKIFRLRLISIIYIIFTLMGIKYYIFSIVKVFIVLPLTWLYFNKELILLYKLVKSTELVIFAFTIGISILI